MSQYIGVGDDVKKEQMKVAKEEARAAAIAAAKARAAGGGLPGGSIQLPVVGDVPVLALAGAAALIGFAVWKKRKKG
jgi:hypothetical protein